MTFRQPLEDLSFWVLTHTAEALLIARWQQLAFVIEMALGSQQQTTYPPFALCKVFLNLSADRWVYVTVKGCISINPADGERRKWARRQMAFVRHSTFWRQLTALYIQSAIIKPKGKTATKCNTNTHFKAWKSSEWDFFLASVYGDKYYTNCIFNYSSFSFFAQKRERPRAMRRQPVTLTRGWGDTSVLSYHPARRLANPQGQQLLPAPAPLTMGAAGLLRR